MGVLSMTGEEHYALYREHQDLANNYFGILFKNGSLDRDALESYKQERKFANKHYGIWLATFTRNINRIKKKHNIV